MAAIQNGPDPTAVRNVEEFVELLRHVRAESGLSFWEIQQRAHQHGYDLEPAAVVQALGRPELPEWQIVVGLLVSSGFHGMQIDRWMKVYRDLAEGHPSPAPAYYEPVRHGEPDTAEWQAPQWQAATPNPAAAPAGRHSLAPRWNRRHGLIAAGVAVAVLACGVFLVNIWDSNPEPFVGAPGATSPATTDVPPAEASPTLEAAATGTPAPETTSAAPRTTAPPAAGVLRSGTATLASGQGLDLDTGLSSGGLDIVAEGGTTLAAGDNGKRLSRMSGMPSQQTCDSLNVGRLDRDATGLTAGAWLCVLTSGRRWARVNVTSTGDGLKLAYTVWA